MSAAQNLIKCCKRAGLTVDDVVLGPLAAADAVLTPEEKDLGVALVDIGGGTTDIVIFHGGAVKHTAVLPLGGGHLTNDIAAGLRTPTVEAEKIKHRYGCARAGNVPRHTQIEVPSVGDREPRVLSRHILCEIIEPRIEEIFTLVSREIIRSGYEDTLASGVVLTGGNRVARQRRRGRGAQLRPAGPDRRAAARDRARRSRREPALLVRDRARARERERPRRDARGVAARPRRHRARPPSHDGVAARIFLMRRVDDAISR